MLQTLKNCERMVIKLKAIMSKPPYVWIAAYNSSCFSNFLEFMDLYFSSPP
jgi:hypothetical protein